MPWWDTCWLSNFYSLDRIKSIIIILNIFKVYFLHMLVKFLNNKNCSSKLNIDPKSCLLGNSQSSECSVSILLSPFPLISRLKLLIFHFWIYLPGNTLLFVRFFFAFLYSHNGLLLILNNPWNDLHSNPGDCCYKLSIPLKWELTRIIFFGQKYSVIYE